MRSTRYLRSALILALISGITACGGGGGGGSDKQDATAPSTGGAPATELPSLPAPDENPGTGDDGSGGAGEVPPAGGTDQPVTGCAADIGQCLDLSTAYVAQYKDNKAAAASYTFDDGYSSSDKIAKIFEDFNARATFYIVPGTVESTTSWDFWKALADRGHEIGNHSMTHTVEMSDPAITDQVLEEEIVGAKTVLTQKLGFAPLTFAFPWHSYTAKAMEIASKNHFAVRKVDIGDDKYAFAFFDQDHTATLDEALATVNGQLADMVKKGGWFVAGGHGVDGNGWSPVTSQFLTDHLNFAQKFSSKLWIDTYANVARYRDCRQAVVPAVVSQSSNGALLQLGGSYNPKWCSQPLTVVVPVKDASLQSVRVHDAAGGAIDSTVAGGKLYFNMVPGGKAVIELARQ